MMNRKQKLGYHVAHTTKTAARTTKSLAHDAYSGAGLLLGFFKHTAKTAVRSTKDAVSDVRQGAKYGWKAD
jgi:hypothetical protein